jgi:hypothetical protein
MLTPASATTDGGFCTAAALERGADGAPTWRLVRGEKAVLIVLVDEGGANEELVVELPPAAVTPGKHSVPLTGLRAHYQRGGQVLTYATWDVGGALELSVTADAKITGEASLRLTKPHVDLLGEGARSRTLPLALTPWAHCPSRPSGE